MNEKEAREIVAAQRRHKQRAAGMGMWPLPGGPDDHKVVFAEGYLSGLSDGRAEKGAVAVHSCNQGVIEGLEAEIARLKAEATRPESWAGVCMSYENEIAALKAELSKREGCDHLDGPYRRLLEETKAERERTKALVEAAEMVVECLREDTGKQVTIHDSCADHLDEALSPYREQSGQDKGVS